MLTSPYSLHLFQTFLTIFKSPDISTPFLENGNDFTHLMDWDYLTQTFSAFHLGFPLSCIIPWVHLNTYPLQLALQSFTIDYLIIIHLLPQTLSLPTKLPLLRKICPSNLPLHITTLYFLVSSEFCLPCLYLIPFSLPFTCKFVFFVFILNYWTRLPKL